MANYYRILSAFSASGDDLFIPVPWNFDDISDISVVVAGTNGSPSICNYWKWNSQLHQVEIENTQNFSQWYAYVSRKEDASTLLQLVEGFVVNPQNIIEQFQKINRLIESLQEDSKTSLRSPDYIDVLIPNANGRKSSFLSFDENGNPSCNIPVETFQDAVGFMEEAVANAEDSFDEFVSQKTSEFNSNAASKKEEINTLATQAETSKNAAITAANGATAAAQAAEASKEEAATSKTSAAASATEAQGFAQAAATAQTAAAQSATNAQASATAAAESATQVQTSATNAQAAATQAQTSESNAAASATQAQASVTQAQGFAQAAQASQAAAAQSETNAQASATAAAGSATQAQTCATNAQAAQAAAQQAAQIAQATDAGALALDKLSAGALYFNSGKLSGSNFAVPTFPFSICATVRIDAWRSASEHSQPIFQYGELGSGTGSTFAMPFANGDDNPVLQLIITDKIDGANKSTLVNCALDLSTFLGKVHTIIGICRAVTAEALNWDIYIDGAKQNIAASAKNAIVSSLSGTRNWAVNTSNYNFSSQPASANPMMLRNLYIFNFDVSAEGSPYSIADYEAGRLIPPALKPSQVSLALENYTIARNATTTLVKDTSGNSNDATVKVSSGGYVAGDNDQSIKVFVDEIKTQINQSNG